MNGQPASSLNSSSGRVPGREVLPSGAPRKFLTFSFFLFLLVALTYFGLSVGYKAYLNRDIDKLEGALNDLRFEVPQEEQDELVSFFSQVANIKKVLDEHVIASNFFSVLEKNTHSKIAYTNMDLSVADRKIGLSGVAADYDALVTQLAIFESVPEIERIVLDNSQRNEGVVAFRVTLTVDKGVFNFKEREPIPQSNSEPTEPETQ